MKASLYLQYCQSFSFSAFTKLKKKNKNKNKASPLKREKNSSAKLDRLELDHT